MKSREQRRKKKKMHLNMSRLLFRVVIVVLVCVTALSIRKIVLLKIEQSELKEQQKALKEKRTKLKNELKNIDDKNYIEEQARKQLNMVKPGEILYMIEKDRSKGKN
ncbi:hypothetical protein AXF21_05655 [Eubacterium minutum ATCC 700079]|mgnify:FL=1|nr:hypothetical protein AXF21_05655 [Eubacterium minutum ATCC 700079]